MSAKKPSRTYNPHHFSNTGMWHNNDPKGDIARKAECLKAMIPDGVRSVLDVGCGNGVITNRLADRFEVTGLDSSAEALAMVNTPVVCASCDAIPLPDKSFDLVLSSELLEHLPDTVMLSTLGEMSRIARKYILLSLPYRECLQARMVLCPACGALFHAYGHLRSFNRTDMRFLFNSQSGVSYLRGELTGPADRGWLPVFLSLRQKTGGQWFPGAGTSVCPECLNKNFPAPPRNLVTLGANLLNRLLAPSHPRWILALYSVNPV